MTHRLDKDIIERSFTDCYNRATRILLFVTFMKCTSLNNSLYYCVTGIIKLFDATLGTAYTALFFQWFFFSLFMTFFYQ